MREAMCVGVDGWHETGRVCVGVDPECERERVWEWMGSSREGACVGVNGEGERSVRGGGWES